MSRENKQKCNRGVHIKDYLLQFSYSNLILNQGKMIDKNSKKTGKIEE